MWIDSDGDDVLMFKVASKIVNPAVLLPQNTKARSRIVNY